jgi:hypothetical protein
MQFERKTIQEDKMKKLFIIFSLVVCLMLGSVNVFAAETAADENSSTKITVSFKSGTGSYSVNGKTVKAGSSAVVKGKIFVPVNVITDAISATLKVDLKKKTAVINYNSVEIKLTANKAEAVIAGKNVKMDAAPYIKNSYFMVSISFLADTLGADITNKNGQVTFVKEIANPNSIKDYSTLIKKTTKSKIGDSYYKWSMMLPDDLKLGYRDFNGDENIFVAQDESYNFSVYMYDKNEDTSIDSTTKKYLEYIKDGNTLIDYSNKTNEDGIEYVDFVYKDDIYTYHIRAYITDKKVYSVILMTEIEESYLDDKYQNLLNSFRFKFDNDGSTEDLSDVSKDGYRKYQDTRLKWSINMLPYWEEIKDEKVQNKVSFNGTEDEYFSVEVYSLEKGETLDSVTQDSINDDTKEYNQNLYTVSKPESAIIGGIKCNKVYYSIKLPDQTIFGCEVYFTDKNYKYILTSEIPEEDYNNLKQRNLVDGMINSFKFTEIDAKKIGKLLDPDKVGTSNKMRTISNDSYSIDIPTSWTVDKENTNTEQNYYSDTANVSISLDDYTYSENVNYYDNKFAGKAGKDFKVETNTYITDKNTSCKKYVLIFTKDKVEYREEMYIIQVGTKVFLVDLFTTNLYYGSDLTNTFNEIWNSLTFK